jgi:hypothetical protein
MTKQQETRQTSELQKKSTRKISEETKKTMQFLQRSQCYTPDLQPHCRPQFMAPQTHLSSSFRVQLFTVHLPCFKFPLEFQQNHFRIVETQKHLVHLTQ